LPSLGCVLYVPMHPLLPVACAPRGVLVQAMQLAPLLQVHWLTAASTIGVDGPREWIECMDHDGHQCAHIHLLPDTDYLAWDALLAGDTAASMPPRCLQRSPPGRVQLLRFHRRRLAGLDMLDAETVSVVSPVSAQLAVRIVRAELLSRGREGND
jgi:hypothetical protein